jgi:hypothetical protein
MVAMEKLPDLPKTKNQRPESYFFISSNTADVMALTPVRSVGSGKGAKSAE